MDKYALGIDFGTLSGRCVLVRLNDGKEIASASKDYVHGVMDEQLPCGTPLMIDWALQHPNDYLDVLKLLPRAVLEQAGVAPSDVVGVGIDFTACTMLPIKKDGTPLCFLDAYKSEPHAYVKLWKHHAAQKEADKLNEIAAQRKERFLQRYGGKISSEWLIPKIWQILNEAPRVYDESDYFIEACDWTVYQLTGVFSRNSCSAGYKAMWSKSEGYPSKTFFAALDPRLENVVEDKLNMPIVSVGTKAGVISEAGAALTGLCAGTAVAAANLDAHVSCLGVGITGPRRMFMIMGTSTCHMLMGDQLKDVPGMCGAVEDGILPGFIGYEAGQSCVGDHFQWVVDNLAPASYERSAKEEGVSIHRYISQLAAKRLPGESGLVALDWWNGNRSVLVDGTLSGMLVGCTLQTKVEDIYRALMEATAFGTRMIIETFEKHGVPVDELIAAGGIAKKDPLMMQIYADVTRRRIKIAGSKETPALSAAMFGAIAAGYYKSLEHAAEVAANLDDTEYSPNEQSSAVYDRLYSEYEKLHDYAGRYQNPVMRNLKQIAAEQRRSISKEG